MAKFPSTGLVVVPQPLIFMARVSGSNTSLRALAICIAPWCSATWRSTRSELACGRCDVAVGATTRRGVQTGAQCRFWKTYTWGSRATSRRHSELEHDERTRLSPKKCAQSRPPATAIRRIKHWQTRVWAKNRPKSVHTSPSD